MIPAILSCVFVIYLYLTLNETKSPDELSDSSSPASQQNADALAKRLNYLETRIEALTTRGQRQGAKK